MEVDSTPAVKIPEVADGEQELTFIKKELGPSKFDANKQSLTWHFGVDGKEGAFIVYTNPSRGDKLMQVLRGFGIAIQPGTKQEVRDPQPGEKVRAYVGKKPSKNDPTKLFSTIVSILPRA